MTGRKVKDMFNKEYLRKAFQETMLVAGYTFILMTIITIFQPTWYLLNLQEKRFNVLFFYLLFFVGTYIKVFNASRK